LSQLNLSHSSMGVCVELHSTIPAASKIFTA
jgi:hypothetical protein